MTPNQWKYICFLRNKTEPNNSNWKSPNIEVRKKAKEESYEALKNADSQEINDYIEVLQEKMKELFPGWESKSKGKFKPNICIDLDGVIADYSKGWQGDEYFGDPIPGAKEALQKIKDKGFNIVIWTARKKKDLVKQYLNLNEIPFNSISENGKPPAKVYIDDRAILFEGNWDDEFIDRIIKFKRWQEIKKYKCQMCNKPLAQEEICKREGIDFCNKCYGQLTFDEIKKKG